MSFLAIQIACAHCGHKFEPSDPDQVVAGAQGRPNASTVVTFIDAAGHTCACFECGAPLVAVEKNFGKGWERHLICRNQQC